MTKIVHYIFSLPFLESLLICAITAVLLTFIKKYLIKVVAYTNKDETHKNTLKGVVFNILQYAIIIGALFLILDVNGLNVTSIIAGLGIVATIIGLALQDTLKDIIMGINIYSNNFYKVGDVVKYKDGLWEVKYFNARVTKLKSLYDESTLTLNNSIVSEMNKVKDFFSFTIYFDFDVDRHLVEKAFLEAIPDIDALYGVRNSVYFGLITIDNKGCNYGMGYHCSPRSYLISSIKVTTILYDYFKKYNIAPTSDNTIIVEEANKKKIVKKKEK